MKDQDERVCDPLHGIYAFHFGLFDEMQKHSHGRRKGFPCQTVIYRSWSFVWNLFEQSAVFYKVQATVHSGTFSCNFTTGLGHVFALIVARKHEPRRCSWLLSVMFWPHLLATAIVFLSAADVGTHGTERATCRSSGSWRSLALCKRFGNARDSWAPVVS